MRQQDADTPIHIQSHVVTVGQDVVDGHPVAVFVLAAAVGAAGQRVGPTATERDAHPHPRLRNTTGRADHQVSLDAPAAAGAFHEQAEGHAVGANRFIPLRISR